MLTVLVGVMVGVAAQTGVSLPSLMPSNEDLARGGSPGGAADGALAEGTVLSAGTGSSESRPEETTGEARGDAPGEQDDAQPEQEGGTDAPEPPPASGEPL